MTDPAKQLECEVCQKSFVHHSALNVHRVVHTGERPFECDVCGSRFSQNSGLNAHLRTKHASKTPKNSRNTPRNLGRNTRKSTEDVLDKSRTVSTPKTKKNRLKTTPKGSRQEEEEDLGAMSDDNDRFERQQEIDSDFVVSSNRDTGNNGNGDEAIDLFESNEDETEEKPRLMIAAQSKSSKINTPLIKSTPFPIKVEQKVPIVQEVGDLMPLMDLSTSAFPPSASQQGVFDMDMDSEIGNVSNISPINTPQFSFEEDSRQISHQIMRVAANSTKDRQDCFRQLLFATVFAFESSPTCTNVEEFFRMMGERHAKK
ncbi:hypothetical protein GCK72_007683 [Caenorhabditis remanei]|uniref:C2H2-type domain-containing protein n=1 Tax=Caenorhabditis remanei TaxID=31234 RepID=A0A6A5HM89_CAERE|nr:hypothetical protein GCK72_007683 [Caenorhabditis remanei]KAF1767724.1 hypothetical protein GCK72_007683 [Caenorhabditis remanei]